MIEVEPDKAADEETEDGDGRGRLNDDDAVEDQVSQLERSAESGRVLR